MTLDVLKLTINPEQTNRQLVKLWLPVLKAVLSSQDLTLILRQTMYINWMSTYLLGHFILCKQSIQWKHIDYIQKAPTLKIPKGRRMSPLRYDRTDGN